MLFGLQCQGAEGISLTHTEGRGRERRTAADHNNGPFFEHKLAGRYMFFRRPRSIIEDTWPDTGQRRNLNTEYKLATSSSGYHEACTEKGGNKIANTNTTPSQTALPRRVETHRTRKSVHPIHTYPEPNPPPILSYLIISFHSTPDPLRPSRPHLLPTPLRHEAPFAPSNLQSPIFTVRTILVLHYRPSWGLCHRTTRSPWCIAGSRVQLQSIISVTEYGGRKHAIRCPWLGGID